MLPHPYVGSYSGENVHQFLQEKWVLTLAKSVVTFVMVSIIDMPIIKYWHNLEHFIDTAKEKIPKQCRIGDTIFYVIGKYWRGFIYKTSKTS